MFASPWVWATPDMMEHVNMPPVPALWLVEAVEAVWGQNRPCKGLRALDLACGGGRNSLYLASLGFQVDAVDIKRPDVAAWPANIQVHEMDLETEQWPIGASMYDLIVVTNYLHRPHFDNMLTALKPQGGVLVYETFMQGNAQFGSPRSPAFLLEPGELLKRLAHLQIMRFEQGMRTAPTPAMIQRVVAISGAWSEIQSETKILNRRD